ncbi:MAG: hypothetical protein IJC43_00595 [Clostridia bacterium]|nr:hypothetical protein [Clostridia bacterium]
MKKILALLLALLLAFTLVACSDEGETPPPENGGGETADPGTPEGGETADPPAPTGELMETSRWSFTYDPEVWVYEEDEPEDSDWTSSITMEIPDPADPEDYLVWFNVYASEGELSSFRSKLANNDFDAYEYAVNNTYKTVNIGGLDFLFTGDEDTMYYFTRDVASGVNVEIEVDGDISNEDVVALVNSIQFTLEDAGNIDPPWPWDGTPYAVEPGEKEVGGFTLKSQQIPFAEPIPTMDTFGHDFAVSGDTAYLVSGNQVKEFSFDGTTLTFVKDIDLGDSYKYVDAAGGSFWFSNTVRELVNWDGEAVVASYDKGNVTTMHPSGEWGIEWGYSGIKKITFADGAIVAEEIATPEVKSITRVSVDAAGNIFVCASDVNDNGHRIFVYDANGTHKVTLQDEGGERMGSVTFATSTKNGYLALDGNMRYLYLYDQSGAYLGHCTFNELFGTDYPWPCDACVLDDGSILCLMTDERPDESSDEVIVFQLSGF